MKDATSVLFGLPGFAVIECEENAEGERRVVIMQVAGEHGCPRCGVVADVKQYDVRGSAVKDLPFGERRLLVVWRKRRYRCLEAGCCVQQLFVERSDEIAFRRRSTERLRRALATADHECRAYSRVAAEYGVSWWLVNDVAVRAASSLPVEPAPVRWLGIDETRTRTPCWVQDVETGRWRREDPWMTSLTNLDTTAGRTILGLTPGRSSAAVTTWLGVTSQINTAAHPEPRRARIRGNEPPSEQLVEQRQRPQMRVLNQTARSRSPGTARTHRPPAHPRRAVSVQMGPDRLTVPTGVPGDRRDRPPPRS